MPILLVFAGVLSIILLRGLVVGRLSLTGRIALHRGSARLVAALLLVSMFLGSVDLALQVAGFAVSIAVGVGLYWMRSAREQDRARAARPGDLGGRLPDRVAQPQGGRSDAAWR